jgi:tRNA threonylcarbamoyladenosine modification (KEOPS) complex  Pcc1 subunit
MKAQAVIRLKFASQKNLDVVLKALSPEAAKPTTLRSRVRIGSAGGVLTLEFEARDTSALRAVVNSYLHWISLSIDTLSKLEQLSKAVEI